MKMILHNYWRSSASYRVRIALNLKGFEYDYRPVHLVKGGGEQKGAGLTSLNPSQQVPVLVHEGWAISESMAILDYLDQIKPSPSLFPHEPRERAEVIRFCEIINSGIQPLQNLKINQWLQERVPSEPGLKDEWNRYWISKGLHVIEGLLAQRSGTYSFGGHVTAADALLVPQIFSSRRFGVDLNPFVNILRVVENCEKLKAFQLAHPLRQPDAET